MKGIYSELSALIAREEMSHKLVIDVERLTRLIQQAIDFDEIPIEELKDKYARAAASVALYQNGYKSVIRGEGLFVNVANCKNPAYFIWLYNNATMTLREKEIAQAVIMRSAEQLNSQLPGQRAMSFTEDGIFSGYEDEPSYEKVLQMLREDANRPSKAEEENS